MFLKFTIPCSLSSICRTHSARATPNPGEYTQGVGVGPGGTKVPSLMRVEPWCRGKQRESPIPPRRFGTIGLNMLDWGLSSPQRRMKCAEAQTHWQLPQQSGQIERLALQRKSLLQLEQQVQQLRALCTGHTPKGLTPWPAACLTHRGSHVASCSCNCSAGIASRSNSPHLGQTAPV